MDSPQLKRAAALAASLLLAACSVFAEEEIGTNAPPATGLSATPVAAAAAGTSSTASPAGPAAPAEATALAMAPAGEATEGARALSEEAGARPLPSSAEVDPGEEFHRMAIGRTRGIDVSYFQGDIDWTAVKADGVGFAYLKATEGGDRVDEKFRANWERAHAAGLKRGAYHFWYHCRSGKEQAAWFIRNVPKDPDALPPVLDMEWTPFSPTCTARPEARTLHDEMEDWLVAVERYYGKRPVIYTSVDFFADRLRDAFHDYHLWVRSVAGHPSTKYGDRKWAIWQYTSTGRTPGVSGKVDQNVFAGSPSEFRQFASGDLRP